jgi:nucleotide-binding universal stress UspA family protein
MFLKLKILIAIDGSKSSVAAVQYASKFFDPQKADFTLIHILPDTTDDETEKSHLKMTEQIQLKMEEFVTKLENAGYDKKQINVNIQKQINGVAKDIVAESENGYDALVIGRRGLNDPTSIIVGATAYHMMKVINHLPVVIVGDNPDPEHILIGLDGSDNSIKAINCVCNLMQRSSRKIVLCHISEKQEIEKQHQQIESIIQNAEDRLVAAGFERPLIKKEILKGILSRAVAISKTAEKHHCGSVVVGRRGLSMIREFMMGRVTMKILHKAHTQAVWIV